MIRCSSGYGPLTTSAARRFMNNALLLPLWETNQMDSGNGQQVWQVNSYGPMGGTTQARFRGTSAMTAVIHATRSSPSASSKLTTKQIQEQRRRHIAEIVIAPPQSEELNYEQQQWLKRRIRSPMPKPYKPCTSVEIPYKWLEDTET